MTHPACPTPLLCRASSHRPGSDAATACRTRNGPAPAAAGVTVAPPTPAARDDRAFEDVVAAVAALHRRDASVTFEDRDGVRLTLAEMSDPDAAGERCASASAAVALELAAAPELVGWSTGWVYYECDDACHEVTVLARGDVEVVVDYTARQFDEGVEHPLVLPVEVYEEWLGDRSSAGAIGSRERGED